MHSKDWIPTFISPLKHEFEELIKFKRSQGYVYGEPACYRLKELDTYLDSLNHENPYIDQEVYDNWMKLNESVSKSTKAKYHVAISTLCDFLRMKGYEGFIQPESPNLKFKSEFIPYIFSNEEINRMFDVLINGIKKEPDNIHLKTFYILICLYYSCGLRKMEALNLKIKDYDKESKVITILNGKNDVSRIIPLSESMNNQLMKYVSSNRYENDEDYIFVGNKSKVYSEYLLYKNYHQLLTEASIPVRYDGKRQRIHDLRHTFCVKSLKQMEEKGFDLYTSLPILSIYLGHAHITETEYYLRLVQKEAEDVAKRAKHYIVGLYDKKDEFYEE